MSQSAQSAAVPRAETNHVGDVQVESDPVLLSERCVSALREIVSTLGPDWTDCAYNGCQGCQAEAAEALRIARDALGMNRVKHEPYPSLGLSGEQPGSAA